MKRGEEEKRKGRKSGLACSWGRRGSYEVSKTSHLTQKKPELFVGCYTPAGRAVSTSHNVDATCDTTTSLVQPQQLAPFSQRELLSDVSFTFGTSLCPL